MELHTRKFKPLNVIIFAIASTIFLTHYGKAQDTHFSQTFAVPLALNPSIAGVSDGDIRLTNDYRNQWYQVDYPFHTLYLAIDGKIKFLNRPWGIGAMVIHDQSSSIFFTADKFYFTLSHSFFYRNHQFVVGLQPGFVFKHYNTEYITFGSQFDPGSETFNPNLPSNEDLLTDRVSYFDLNAGVLYRTRFNRTFATAGISFHHTNLPVESFFGDNDSLRLPMRITLHGDIAFPVGEKFEIDPGILYSNMKGANEFLGGLVAAYYPGVSDFVVKKIYVLSSLRINPVKNIDAVILGAGARIGNLDFCISYDLTVSSFRKASNYQGAFEISLMLNINTRGPSGITEPCMML